MAALLDDQRSPAGRLPAGALHVTNGDSTVLGLRATGLAEDVLPWRDVLHEGPVPAVPDVELAAVRGAFLGAGAANALAARDERLSAHRDGAYVLWFEADLYDQLQVVQVLARLGALGVAPEAITLVCIGEHLGRAPFGGLGELSAAELAALPATAAVALTADALAYAARAWDALRAGEPSGLGDVAAAPHRELRFVAEAFDRLGREYPSTRDGLALSERRLLAAVAAGSGTAGAAFVAAARREVRPFLGDTWAFDRLRRLRDVPEPLVAVADPVAPGAPVALTEAGRAALAGTLDHVARNGVDRWIGGVRLEGRAVAWRWDEGLERVAAA